MSLLSDADALSVTLHEITAPGWLDDLAVVEHAAAAVMQAGWVLDSAVRQARSGGATWQQIGDRLGISRQAAQQRWPDGFAQS
jgi:hypothetical protein